MALRWGGGINCPPLVPPPGGLSVTSQHQLPKGRSGQVMLADKWGL